MRKALEDFLIEIQKFNRGNSSGLPASLVIFSDGSGYVQDGRDKHLVSFSSYGNGITDEQRLEIIRSINTTIWPIHEVVDAAFEASMDGLGYSIPAKDVYEFLWQCHDDIEGLYPQLDGMPRKMPDVFEKLYNQKCTTQEPFPYPPGA